MRFVHRAAPLLAFFVLACEAPPETAEPTADTAAMAATSEADVRSAIDGVRSDWLAAAEADDAAAIAGLYADDATYVTPDGQVLEGRQGIEQGLSQSLPMMTELNITSSRDPFVSGDLAIDVGQYTSTMSPGGGEGMASDGFYTVVLRRQDDGSWKIVYHLAAQPAEMPGG